MNKLEIFQEVFGKDYVFTENELSRLMRVADLVRADEREACAKVCDDWKNSFEIDTRGWWASSLCADTIRKRGEK